MPTSPLRVRARVLLAAGAALLVPALVPGALVLGTPAQAVEASPSPSSAATSAAPSPTCGGAVCLPTSAPPSPSAKPTATATTRPTATRRPTPSATPRRTRSPQPVVTATTAPTTDAEPTEVPELPDVEVGGVVSESPTPVPTIEPQETASGPQRGEALTRLLVLVLGAGVLLGLGGAVGLYVTRHPHE